MILAAQLLLSTLAAYAFARYRFRGRSIAFALVLLQLMVMPDILIVENYRTLDPAGTWSTPWRRSACRISLPPSRSSCCGRPS
jgi:sn-glycerol 3-phosphate transport system permease protein